MKRVCIVVKGIVQGVGFRPFVYNLARQLKLKGYVTNTTEGVFIDIEGENLKEFIDKLQRIRPPLSKIVNIDFNPLPYCGYETFHISKSINKGRFTLISPDVAICRDCLNEVLDKKNRRYHYPFTNCTNCGPRYSITMSVPYDRPNTTMNHFLMCPQCLLEYDNPKNRRFHTQPNACHECGPKLTLIMQYKNYESHDQCLKPETLYHEKDFTYSNNSAVKKTIHLLKQGAVIAVKGIGGFHIVCDATNENAIRKIRKKKRKNNKPFALMAPNIEKIKKFVHVTLPEERILKDRQAPIVLLRKRNENKLPESIAPNNNYLGFMLPYTPLHYLLFYYGIKHGIGNSEQSIENQHFKALVMTSGNIVEEPIVKDNHEAMEKLSYFVDAFLIHNRDIFMRLDDSVVRLIDETPLYIRRARGYVPEPIELFVDGPEVLAVGADLKNTFTITKGTYAIMSQHIGDMENYETQFFFEEVYNNLKSIYKINPVAIAFDRHPHYFSTLWAKKQGLKSFPIQHHHAHVASVMAENRLEREVFGIAFDGSGYGTDGCMWGGEFLITNIKDFDRFAHFDYIPLLGGEMAIKQPWRMAVSMIIKALDNKADICLESLGFIGKYGREVISNLKVLYQNGSISPLSSGVGRLFDGTSAILGICDENTFEGEAAIALETNIREHVEDTYEFHIHGNHPKIICCKEMISGIITDKINKVDVRIIAAKFHNTLVNIIFKVLDMAYQDRGLKDVVLSGGVFQNLYLLKKVIQKLTSEGFYVFYNQKVPANDGGISLGQAYILRANLK